jgi:hypothetical protein
MKHEHYGNFIVADAAPDKNRPTGNRSDEFAPCRGADRLPPPTGVSLGFLAEILPFQTLSELRTVA